MDFRVYVITAEVPEFNRSHLDVAREAIAGGATVIQLREKTKPTRQIVEIGLRLRQMTQKARVSLIVNDRIDIALAIGADGVHLGQDDMPLLKAKKIVSEKMIIGVSATNLDEAIKAEKNGANYLGIGPIFPTPSKENAASPIGLESLQLIRSKTLIPIVAIGGITLDNVSEVLRAGADGIAVISAVTMAQDMKIATKLLRQKVVGD